MKASNMSLWALRPFLILEVYLERTETKLTTSMHAFEDLIVTCHSVIFLSFYESESERKGNFQIFLDYQLGPYKHIQIKGQCIISSSLLSYFKLSVSWLPIYHTMRIGEVFFINYWITCLLLLVWNFVTKHVIKINVVWLLIRSTYKEKKHNHKLKKKKRL